jgi:mono/diheme cytochrome c family protein
MWDEKPLTEANVREMILKGGGKMTGFEDQLTAKELDNLIAYLKSL